MEKDKNCKNEEMLCIKFNGKKFEDGSRAVPIYELGQVLISFQQIIYKAFAYKNDVSLGDEERKKLSLQMTSRRTGSDIYGFTAFLSDPVVHAFIAPLVVEAVIALGKYASGKIGQLLSKNEPIDNYIAAIFPQLLTIMQRIDSIGGVCSIQISVPNGPSVTLGTETKKVMKDLKDKVFYGDELEIRGIVIEFYPGRNLVIVEDEKFGNIKVYLGEVDFNEIRYKTERSTIIIFKGKPIYPFGKESYLKIEEFEANSIVIKKKA